MVLFIVLYKLVQTFIFRRNPSTSHQNGSYWTVFSGSTVRHTRHILTFFLPLGEGDRLVSYLSLSLRNKQKHENINNIMVQVDRLSKLLFCPSHITQSSVRNHLNTLQPRQMKLGRIEKVKTGSMFFFSMTSCALTVHAISAASREGHPRVPETKRKVISVIINLNYSYPQKFSFFITARHSWTNQKFSWFTPHKVTNKQCVK